MVVVPIHLEKTVGSWRYLLLAAPYSARSRIVKRKVASSLRWLCVCWQAPCEYAVVDKHTHPCSPEPGSNSTVQKLQFRQRSADGILTEIYRHWCAMGAAHDTTCWLPLPLGMVLWYVLTTHFGTEVTSFPRFLLMRLVSSNKLHIQSTECQEWTAPVGVHWFLARNEIDEVMQQAFRSGFFLAAALHIAPSFGRRRGVRSRKTDCRSTTA